MYLRFLRDAAIFVPAYLVLDWASFIQPLGPFNITPWNPQPALAIAWMLLGGMRYAPLVFLAICLADLLVRGAPGGYTVMLATGLILSGGYTAIAWTLRSLACIDPGLRSIRELTIFVATVAAGTLGVGAAFIGALHVQGLLEGSFTEAWMRFWIGDSVGTLVTAPLLLLAMDPPRRQSLLQLGRQPEAYLQLAVLAATLWLTFDGWGVEPAKHFYLLFLPLIWISARAGMVGAVVAIALVQVGVVADIHGASSSQVLPVADLQALMAALTLTGLFLGMTVDERARTAERLRQSLRLAAAGEMAGAIAHEVNQPLTALANYGRAAQMLLARNGRDEAGPLLADTVGKMLVEADRAADIVRRLRDFFREGTTRLERVTAAELLASGRRIGDQLIGARPISLDARSEGGPCSVLVDRLQIELVLRNLLANAVESLAAHPREDARILLAVRRAGRGDLGVSVMDNGPGLGTQRMDRLFEPVATGKAEGMGLGLAVSRAIAEAHGGSLDVLHAGSPAEFCLILPRHD